MPTSPGRITRVRFAGLRTAASVELDLQGLTVLIGPNGVGKSTLIEGLELLRKVVDTNDFVRTVYEEHGGPQALLAHGASELALGVEVAGEGGAASYELRLGNVEGSFGIAHESLQYGPARPFVRTGSKVVLGANPAGTIKVPRPGEPFLLGCFFFDVEEPVSTLLAGVEVHGPFSTAATWLRGPSADRTARSDNVLQATHRLARGGANLPNAYHALRNRDDWADTLDTIRLLIDEDIRDVLTPASASGGSIGLALRYRTGTVPAFALSDGTLGLLSLVAIAALDGGTPPRSLLVLDEPDLHLHPAALRYVVALLERCAEKHPVVIATHSDQLLDCLSDPARSVVLCDLDEHRHLRLRRPDAAQLHRWLGEYRGVGQLRAEGYDSLVFPQPAGAVDPS